MRLSKWGERLINGRGWVEVKLINGMDDSSSDETNSSVVAELDRDG